MTNDDIGRKLDTITTILKLAHSDAIAKTRTSVRSRTRQGRASRRRLEVDGGGQAREAVAKKSGKSERSVQNYIAELLELGVLEKQGGGPNTEYRSTGLI